MLCGARGKCWIFAHVASVVCLPFCVPQFLRVCDKKMSLLRTLLKIQSFSLSLGFLSTLDDAGPNLQRSLKILSN